MKRRPACLALTLAAIFLAASARGDLRDDFADPPPAYKTRPLWFWNAPPSKDQTRIIMQKCRDSGYYGFGTPFIGPVLSRSSRINPTTPSRSHTHRGRCPRRGRFPPGPHRPKPRRPNLLPG